MIALRYTPVLLATLPLRHTAGRDCVRWLVRLGGFLLVRPNNRQEMRLQPKRRRALAIPPLVGCAKRATDCHGNLARCPFLECVLKHEGTIKEKCPMGKKNLDKLPNGHYSDGEMKAKLTRKQQEALASLVMAQVANLLEYSEMRESEHELEDVSVEEIGKQLSIWMKKLPGTIWDTRLPQ